MRVCENCVTMICVHHKYGEKAKTMKNIKSKLITILTQRLVFSLYALKSPPDTYFLPFLQQKKCFLRWQQQLMIPRCNPL